MKVLIEKHTDLEKKLQFEIPQDFVQERITSALKDLQKKVKVKGFRPGKIPLDMVRKLYLSDAKSQAISDVVNHSYEEALKEHDIDVMSQPRIENVEFEEKKPLKFTAYVEVYPQVVLKKYRGFDLIRDKFVEPSADEINKMLEEMRQSRAQVAPVAEPRKSKAQDFVLGNVRIHQAYLTPVLLEFLKQYRLDSSDVKNYMIPVDEKHSLGNQCFGKSVDDDFEIKIKLPEYLKKEIKTSDFIPVQFKVESLKTLSFPPLDDEFAKSLGGHADLETLKKEISKHIEIQKKGAVSKKLADDLLEKLVSENPVSVPEQLSKRQEERMLEVVRNDLLSGKFPISEVEEYVKKNEKILKERSLFELKKSLLMNKISKAEKIEVSKQDLDRQLQIAAHQLGKTLEETFRHYQQNNWLSSIIQDIIERDGLLDLAVDDEEFKKRTGLVHRIDKETSGCLIVAKQPDIYYQLTQAFKYQRIKIYTEKTS
ncbi:MAG: trigger factor [Deltaproteobacteria bacterium]|nr:trigger factor [Deltaproteobacteria bacterium]